MKTISRLLLLYLLNVPWFAHAAATMLAGPGADTTGAGEAVAATPRLACFATSDLVRVFDDGYGQPEPRLTTINLFGLRNEVVSAQCVIVAHDDLENDYTKDPSVLYQARRQAIEETLDLEQSPRVLLQTHPLEYSPVAHDCAIDVHGWAEPGTTITINGQKVAVASDGLFLQQLAPSRAGKIVVEAQGNNGKKTLVRQFRLLL